MRNIKETKIRKSSKAGGLLSLIIIGAIVGSVYLTSVNEVIEEQTILAVRTPFLVVGDAVPGDASGFFMFMVKNHSANPALEYNRNLTNYTGGNTKCYEWLDSGNGSATGETPYSTAFDIILKVGVTDEDGTYSSNGTWNDNYTWMLMTCADITPAIGADTNMTLVNISATDTYRWLHFYLNNAGSGYTILEGVSFNVSSVKYYVQRIV